MYLLTVSIKRLGLDFLKKYLFNVQYYLFFRILEAYLERPGLIIETLEYAIECAFQSCKQQHKLLCHLGKMVAPSYTGKSLSEALILASTNPHYDDRLFIE